MLAANHMIVAGVVGEYIGNPFLAFLAGIVIHFILDAVPHFDTTDNGKFTFRQIALAIIDLLIGLYIIFYVMHISLAIGSPFIWGAIGGNVPDVLDNIPFWNEWFAKSKLGKPVHALHESIHNRSLDKHPVWGILTQYSIIAIFVWFYLTG